MYRFLGRWLEGSIRETHGRAKVPHGTSGTESQREAAGEVFGVIETALRHISGVRSSLSLINPKGPFSFRFHPLLDRQQPLALCGRWFCFRTHAQLIQHLADEAAVFGVHV